MEIDKAIQREYNPTHPNYERWKKARDISEDRARFVEIILSEIILTENLKILDIGSGEGYTSTLLAKKNVVVSIEPKSERINKISKRNSIQPIIADSLSLPVKSSTFSVIILQDVIEHLTVDSNFADELKSILTENGMIYLSTPNRFSFLNIISDPHWGMPFLCLFRRKQIKKYFLKCFRISDYNRNDIAQLFSLSDLTNLFNKDFSLTLFTKFSVDYLLNGGKGLVWSKLHLRLVKFVNNFRLGKLIKRIANDRAGFINKFFTPTYYLILKKK